MANEGTRCFCRCILNMTIIIGKKEEVLFAMNRVYPCMIRDNDKEARFYKIYGDEFALSCNEDEFYRHFRLIKHKETC